MWERGGLQLEAQTVLSKQLQEGSVWSSCGMWCGGESGRVA